MNSPTNSLVISLIPRRFRVLDEGKKWLSSNWKLCEPLKTAENVQTLKDFLQEVYINLAMVNYPYETNFLAPLPGNPIDVSEF